jgi:hypothetical protein
MELLYKCGYPCPEFRQRTDIFIYTDPRHGIHLKYVLAYIKEYDIAYRQTRCPREET